MRVRSNADRSNAVSNKGAVSVSKDKVVERRPVRNKTESEVGMQARFSDCRPTSPAHPKILDLCGCSGLRRFGPLRPLLPKLEVLSLSPCQFEDLPVEVSSGQISENIADSVRAHYADVAFGERRDADVKVFLLGNGGVGKTQLCRRLRGLQFDPAAPTTHGIQLGEMTLELEHFPEPIRLHLWDFGGQDIYHGSHALFLPRQGIFLLLWMPELERGGSFQENGLVFRHLPLSYWLDYIRAFAGTESSVLIVQSQCDTRENRVPQPSMATDDFLLIRHLEVSAYTDRGLGLLKENLREAVRDRFARHPPPSIGVGRVVVRDRLRKMLSEDQALPSRFRKHRWLERDEFYRICDEVGGVSNKEASLNFLHQNGVIFYRPSVFRGRIVLDQTWALEAIYALFHREKILRKLRGYGRFTREDLEVLIWSQYTPTEQKVFLEMMESCGICFKVRELPGGEWEYLAPELLPAWSEVQELLLGRLRDDPPNAEATARYAFLHEGVLRGYLSKLGNYAKDAPIYWKYGCWFYEHKTRSEVLIESEYKAQKEGTGRISC
jgi:internalin A